MLWISTTSQDSNTVDAANLPLSAPRTEDTSNKVKTQVVSMFPGDEAGKGDGLSYVTGFCSIAGSLDCVTDSRHMAGRRCSGGVSGM